MKDLVGAIARHVPSYPASLKPATPEEIQQLQERLGRPLPSSYRSLLELMGHGMGPINMFDADFDITTVINAYAPGRWRAPERYILIARQEIHPHRDVYLDTGWDPSEPRVVRFESWGEVTEENEDFSIEFSSLAEMWFTAAFLQLRMPLLPWRASYRPGRRQPGQEPVSYMERLDWLARRLGFERLPYTTGVVSCYERGDAALLGYMPNPYSMSMSLAAREEQELRRIEQLLEDHACVVRSGN